MQLYETQEELFAGAYGLNMVGEACRIEFRNGSPVIMAGERIIGRVAND